MINDINEEELIKSFRQKMWVVIDRVKDDLRGWIHAQHGDDVFSDPAASQSHAHRASEVTAALLDTAIDRKIAVLGEADARYLILLSSDIRNCPLGVMRN